MGSELRELCVRYLYNLELFQNSNPKKTASLLSLSLGLLFLLAFQPVQTAYAILPSDIHFDTPIVTDVNPYLLSDISTIRIDDPSLAGNGRTNSITVTISDVDLVNFTPGTFDSTTLTLTEIGDTGIFLSKALIFTYSHTKYPLTSVIGITQDVDDGLGNGCVGGAVTDPSVIDTICTSVMSTSDPAGLSPFNLQETGVDTRHYTGSLKLSPLSTISPNQIKVSNNDILSLTFAGVTTNALIASTDPGTSELVVPTWDGFATDLAQVTVTYGAVSNTVMVDPLSTGGGSGTGGLLIPGSFLEFIYSLVAGGSPYVVSPPSFGGGYYHYSDGLTFTQGKDPTTLDISKYNQELPQQVMVSGQQVNMTFKTFESYNPTGVIHMGLYIIPRGQDMITSNSIGSIVWEKGKDVEVNDPNHILSNATASSTDDGKFQYTQFTFVPTKSYDKMSFLARAWNDHMYSTDVRVHDEVDPSPMQYNQPDWLHVYNNLHDADYAVEGAGFVKPNIFSHVSTSEQVWLQTDRGTVLWFYDEKDQAVAVEAFDSNRNVIWVQSELLHKIIPSPTQGPDASYSGNHLNRWDKIALENAQKAEEDRVKTTLQRMGYPVYWDHTITR